MALRLMTALVLTVLIELGVLLTLRERRVTVLGMSVAANVVTNLSLNLWLSWYDAALVHILLAEAIIVVVEAAAYRCVVRTTKQAAIYSILCNGVSFLTGELLQLLAIIIMQ
ncbi:MAG: hypothetical protein IJ527_04950 [Prevotella sp.]|nr:hypothetical protein [Prevotella sp.]